MDTAKVCPVCGKSVLPDAPQGLCPECLIKAGFDTKKPGGAATAFAPPGVEEIARLFPQLEIVALLGRGGMGAVYKVRQPALGRYAALKILPPKRADDPGFAERFNREARALARLNHPNIVGVYDFGEAGGLPFFLMEYVEGSTLRQVEQAIKLSPRETLGIVMQICEALQFAHDEGVVHRDIKPENILIDAKGRVKIADFGIAKVVDQEEHSVSLTEAKDVVGTAHYMAPEQLENPQAVDHRADIFSLGVVFYELLTGELPLGKFAPPSVKAQADARLDHVVLHTLEKEPDRRYQQAREVRTDVANIAADPAHAVPPAIPPAAAVVKTPVPPARNSALKIFLIIAGIGVVAVLLLVTAAAVFLIGSTRTAQKSIAVQTEVASDYSALLNPNQRLVIQYCSAKSGDLYDARTFTDWSPIDRANLENHLIDIIKGPHTKNSTEYYQAINSLGALHSTNALPLLRQMALAHRDTIVRLESSNRHRWMAIRAIGIIGDTSFVPELIHLLYHNNFYVRWWAQISLVRLTGQNFGADWNAWSNWWNSENRQPPFKSEMVRWWRGQAPPEQLRQVLATDDQKFLASLRQKTGATPETEEK